MGGLTGIKRGQCSLSMVADRPSFKARLEPRLKKNTSRVGQDRLYAPYMTVYLVNSLPKTP